MSTLLYRGHSYTQHTDCTQKPAVQLTYRRQVYRVRHAELRHKSVQLKYRGVSYTH